MKRKILLTALLTGVLALVMGWFLRGAMQPGNQKKQTEVASGIIDTVPQADSMKSTSFANAISGHFILAESNCAGFSFINDHLVLWTNEIACNDPDSLRLRWLSDSLFMTRTILRVNENCPPTVGVYKVVGYDGKHLTLKSVWTGWNDAKDEKLEFTKYAGK